MKRQKDRIIIPHFTRMTSALIVMLLLTAVYSCSSYSVKDIREKKQSTKKSKYVDDFARPELSKTEMKENDKVLMKLVSQHSSKVDIVLPNMLGAQLDSAGTVVISPESIMDNWRKSQSSVINNNDGIFDSMSNNDSISNLSLNTDTIISDLSLDNDSLSLATDSISGLSLNTDITSDLPLNKIEDSISNLSLLLENTRGANIPERNGVVNTGFIIRVPKEFINTRVQLTVSPKIIFNKDSVMPLKDVVIKGANFAAKQEESYKTYESYTASIVGRGEYDDKFLDKEGISSDLKDRQDLYYQQYYNSWKKQMDYEKWKEEREDMDSYELARKIGYRKQKEYEAIRAARDDAQRRLAQGKDTVGVYARHMARFEKKYAKYPSEFVIPRVQLEDVPKGFKDLYVSNRTFSDLTNLVLTEDDSLSIVKHRYLYDAIAVNEMRDSLKEERMRIMIPYPYRKDALVDTIMDGTQDFVFYYPHKTILPQGPANYQLQVDNVIDIFGHAPFTPASDGITTYEIVSLNDLIKPELETKGTKINRNLYLHLTIYPKYEIEKSEFKVHYQDNKEQIAKLKDEYQKYVVEPGYILDSVVMQTTSSLDGSFMYNWKLSDKRGQALKKYIGEQVFPTVDVENMFRHKFKGEDWNTLVDQIKSRSDMPNKDDILSKLGSVADVDDTDIVERDIRRTYKKDYKIMQDSIYPLLRKTAFVFFMHRPGMEVAEEMKYTKIQGYPEALQQMRERKYWDAIKLLSENPDFNTALCLAGMGENQKAYDLLTYLDKDADVNYLLAIVAYRMGYDNEAIDCLKKACEEDKSKLERIPYDPEIVELIKKYNL